MADQEYPFTNRLINEQSPYLKQHAHNPVDWFPWGDEAFLEAKKNDKPIFLSIGYATCHWCHVMENESFEDPNIAKLMNEAFVNIKVDREELPEVDSLYMEFAQSMMAGAAGWPLNVILTPDLKPFFSVTYVPPTSRNGMMGIVDLVNRIKEIWYGPERASVMDQASKIIEVFEANAVMKGDQIPNETYVENSANMLFQLADPVWGGMKGAPKFPIAYQIHFLMNYSAMTKDSRALFLAEKTLEMMQRGGIYDHLGGGFCRYSVDEQWIVPHFEKMLYDNALLSYSYLAAWQITKNPLYRKVTEETLNYVLRDMTDSKGGFYSAEDADSEGVEGKFYTWTIDEARGILDQHQLHLLTEFYGLTSAGNFEGRSILHIKEPISEYAEKRHMKLEGLQKRLKTTRQKLFNEREKRMRPFKDDKVLVAWNGMMIRSLAHASAAFTESRYFDAASKAAHFLKETLWDGKQLLRRYRDGDARYNAGLEEYAFMIQGAIALFMVDGGAKWLGFAVELANLLQEKFKIEGGAFYMTDGTDSNLILRKCQFSDGAEPSGNAIHCENLLNLYHLTGETQYITQAEDILKAVKFYLDSYPPGYIYHVKNLQRYFDQRAPQIVISLNKHEDLKERLKEALFGKCIAHKTVIWRREGDEELFALLPSTFQQKPLENKTTLYICYHGACQEPLTDEAKIFEAIQHL